VKKIFDLYLSKRLHRDKIDYFIQTLLQEKSRPNQNLVAKRVAVVQKEIKPVKHVPYFIHSIYSIIERATDQGATYVIFPEYIFFDLFGVLPFFQSINKFLQKQTITKSKDTHIAQSPPEHNRLLFHVFDIFATPTEKAILHIMKSFAKYFSIYIYTGSYIHKENKQLYNVYSLISPDVNIIYTQRKVHLT